ncbi:MAG: hypothetical protein HOL04_08980 [Gammaproteobacteria bacterium]|jgi:hypothetical protein|nr:hypothetical protein [Gammaproteobacteria bacterium]MBT4605660.1 hypothetical protein [Thiotrichales bacterium]MBT3473452.1 hypothetical protein [Gammaproteobacteria bacterium]MBT3968074.1 hypothetical protein [Gammaproteobacteria bacterium]MBT4079899.1 hypothetical protein [Gammaproteobacteria bacterium]
MSEQEAIEQNSSEEQIKEIPMEEMMSSIYGNLKQGVGLVAGGVGSVAKYSWLGMRFAGDDLKSLSMKALEQGKSHLPQSKKEEPEAA